MASHSSSLASSSSSNSCIHLATTPYNPKTCNVCSLTKTVSIGAHATKTQFLQNVNLSSLIQDLHKSSNEPGHEEKKLLIKSFIVSKLKTSYKIHDASLDNVDQLVETIEREFAERHEIKYSLFIYESSQANSIEEFLTILLNSNPNHLLRSLCHIVEENNRAHYNHDSAMLLMSILQFKVPHSSKCINIHICKKILQIELNTALQETVLFDPLLSIKLVELINRTGLPLPKISLESIIQTAININNEQIIKSCIESLTLFALSTLNAVLIDNINQTVKSQRHKNIIIKIITDAKKTEIDTKEQTLVKMELKSISEEQAKGCIQNSDFKIKFYEDLLLVCH